MLCSPGCSCVCTDWCQMDGKAESLFVSSLLVIVGVVWKVR